MHKPPLVPDDDAPTRAYQSRRSQARPETASLLSQAPQVKLFDQCMQLCTVQLRILLDPVFLLADASLLLLDVA